MTVVERIQKWINETGKKDPKETLLITNGMMNELTKESRPKFIGRIIRFDYPDGLTVIVVMSDKGVRHGDEFCYYRLFELGDYRMKAMPVL